MAGISLDLGFFATRRVPLILQSEAAECGLACLAMIAGYHGYRADLPGLRRRFDLSMQGASLSQLMKIASALQMNSRAVRLEPVELNKLALPCMLHWNLDHFVVLEKVTTKGIRVADPASGLRHVSRKELDRAFSGVAIEFSPEATFRRAETRTRLRFRHLAKDMPGLKRSLLIVFGLSVALQFFALLLPFYSQIVIDSVVVSGDRELLTLLAMSFALLVSTQSAVSMLRAWVVVTLGTRFNLQLGRRVFHHLLRLPLAFFEKRHLGDIQSRFNSATSLQQLLTRQFVEAAVDGLMTVTTLVVMFMYQPKLCALVVASVIVYLGFRLLLFRAQHGAAQEVQVSAAMRDNYLLESVRGLLALKCFSREPQRDQGFQNRLAEAWNAMLKSSRLGVWQLGTSQLIFGLQFIAVVWLGAIAIIDGSFTVGMLVAFLAYRGLFTERAGALIDHALEFRLAGVQLDRLADIVHSELEPAFSTQQFAPAHGRNRLRLQCKNLSFRFSANEPDILRGLSLDIRSGEHVVLTGPSGCGKTTLIKLLMGLLEPTSGQVLISGRGLQRFGVLRYRREIAAVMQDDCLFSGTLLDNICFFDPEPDLRRVQACARFADVAGVIESMPMQYLTPVGDMGTSLSGGQRQRVLLARALYSQPRILFLDEFTSHLDPQCELRINQRLARLPLTRVVIAHRAESIRCADREIRMGRPK